MKTIEEQIFDNIKDILYNRTEIVAYKAVDSTDFDHLQIGDINMYLHTDLLAVDYLDLYFVLSHEQTAEIIPKYKEILNIRKADKKQKEKERILKRLTELKESKKIILEKRIT